MKCSMSGALSVMPVLRHWVRTVAMRTVAATDAVLHACQAFIMLVTLVDMLVEAPRGRCSEEMSARGRDEQEESVDAVASQRGPSCTRPCPTCGHTGLDPSACLCRQCMRPCCSSVCEARHLAGLAGYVPCRGPLN